MRVNVRGPLAARVARVAVAFIVMFLSPNPVVAEDKAADVPEKFAVESSNPLSGDAEAIAQGKKLFFKWCVACHGVKADGKSRFGSYAANLRKYWRGYGAFVEITLNGRPKKQMPPWNKVLDVRQITTIGAYLETRSIKGANWK